MSFTASGYTVGETAGAQATISASLSAVSSQAVTAYYQTSNGTAQASVDYLPATGAMTFAPGQTFQNFTVPVLDDNVSGESNETVSLALTGATGATVSGLSSATLTIVEDNDALPAVSFTASGYTVGETAGAQATISASLSAVSSQAVTAYYQTSNGTARAGTDYTGVTGAVTFAPTQTLQRSR